MTSLNKNTFPIPPLFDVQMSKPYLSLSLNPDTCPDILRLRMSGHVRGVSGVSHAHS